MTTFEDAGSYSESAGSATSTIRKQFTFVCESTQSSTRSHAMREHWRERKKRERVHKVTRHRPVLRPKVPRESDITDKAHRNDDPVALIPLATSLTRAGKTNTNTGPGCELYVGTDQDDNPPLNIVASELLLGITRVLSPSKLDPFDTFPVRLTSGHHKLLHHCE